MPGPSAKQLIGGGLVLGGLAIAGYLIKLAVDSYYIGRRIRNQAFNGFDPANANYHRNISNAFHQILENDPNFIWDAGVHAVGADDMRDFLDADVGTQPAMTVNCQQTAGMLAQIFLGDAPQEGIGLPVGNVALEEYQGGINQLGFFATQAGPVLRNEPNVYRLDNGARRPLRFWHSHWVVRVGGGAGGNRYYDPSYGTSQGGTGEYAAPANMSVADVDRHFNVPGNVINGVYIEDVMVVNAGNPHQGYYLACQREANGTLRQAAAADPLLPFVVIGPIIWGGMSYALDQTNFVANLPGPVPGQLAALVL